MNDIISLDQKKRDRALTLAQERRKILAMTPEQALDTIAENPLPVTLVQSFSAEDLYFLVHHIGADDAVPVLALASNEQWEYLTDMEVWHQGQPNNLSLTRWLNRLLKADPDRFTHWIIHDQRDLLEYYLFRNIEVHIREYEQDPGEVGEDFFSEDQVHYLRLRKFAADNAELQAFETERDTFVLDILKRLAVFDLVQHQQIVLASSVVLPAEAEEELLRLRNVRLAEKGFLPFDEAIGLYQPLTVAEFFKRQQKPKDAGGRQVESYPLPVASIQLNKKADLFVRTLARIQDQTAIQRLQAEFAGLCNQAVSADQKPMREKTDLSRIVDKVSGYISLGLEKIDAEAEAIPADPYRAANLIQTYLLADIFRVGYGCALTLKWSADQWRKTSWFEQAGLPLGFWGEAWLGVLGGLLIKKPQYFDNYATDVLYREFATLEDITITRHALDQIIAMDQLLARLSLDLSTTAFGSFFTYANLLLTLWANYHLGLPHEAKTPQPLGLDDFHRFFEDLWQDSALPRRIKDTMRESFLNWLAHRTALATFEITERLGPSLEGLFKMIENELGAVAAKDLDPRHIYLLLLKTP